LSQTHFESIPFEMMVTLADSVVEATWTGHSKPIGQLYKVLKVFKTSNTQQDLIGRDIVVHDVGHDTYIALEEQFQKTGVRKSPIFSRYDGEGIAEPKMGGTYLLFLSNSNPPDQFQFFADQAILSTDQKPRVLEALKNTQ